ncbi:hypothetical protein [Thermofilum pendens]|uniref:hypothetical protein n=1 Tax=Thermofilum pendens TaxID=2269 RepID=UPI00069B9F67|nr:hypothetical protein [Thermofilum pendens]
MDAETVREVLLLAESLAAREGLVAPSVGQVVVSGEPPGSGMVKVYEGVWVDLVSESIYVEEGTLDNVVFRLLVGYFALSVYKSFGKIHWEVARDLARKHFFTVLVKLVRAR